jgi:hypothetical protein
MQNDAQQIDTQNRSHGVTDLQSMHICCAAACTHMCCVHAELRRASILCSCCVLTDVLHNSCTTSVLSRQLLLLLLSLYCCCHQCTRRAPPTCCRRVRMRMRPAQSNKPCGTSLPLQHSNRQVIASVESCSCNTLRKACLASVCTRACDRAIEKATQRIKSDNNVTKIALMLARLCH